MVASLKRYARETEDWLRYHPRVRDFLSLYQRWGDRLRSARDPQEVARSIVRLCAAARLARDADTVRCLQRQIHERLVELDGRELDWSEFVAGIDDRSIVKAAILKPHVGPNEKGLVFVSFENQWIKLLRLADLPDFAERYDLVLAPSGSPHNLINYAFAAAYPGALFTLISNGSDLEALPGVSDKVVTAPLYASSWVNPDRFTPRPKAERAFDLIMVANFAKFKRHYVLFRALQSMPRDIRVLLIGQHQDQRTSASVEEEARWYGVRERFTLRVNQSYADVTSAFCASRASVILSRREGSCVVVAESMFADAPVAVLDNAELGSRAFINDRTGMFVREDDLAEQLADLVAHADCFAPRAWAEANISCWRSSAKLNGIVKEHAVKHGRSWTQDLAPLQWCPDPQLVRGEDRAWAAAERRSIAERFGVTIGPETA
ncbi:MAG: glycosyltransferase [Gemmataceae bacterium]|nr:glycosyltransferase [Gemmataceae bacterium]